MKENVIENNRLIAEFMGWVYAPNVINNGEGSFVYKDSGGTTYATLEMFKYHSSWDWLHPAWTKCYFKLIDINTTSCWHYIGSMKEALVKGDIEKAFTILVAAINFINE